MQAVLPALIGKGYEGPAIQEGDTASKEFLRVMFSDVGEAERRIRLSGERNRLVQKLKTGD
jgi:hypothetical protein